MSSPESTPAAVKYDGEEEDPVRQVASAERARRRTLATEDDLARLATREGVAWVCSCGHNFGTAANTTAENLDVHEESGRHKTKLATKQRLANKQMEISRGAAMLRAWLIPKEAAVASTLVASSAKAHQQEAGSGVACVGGVKNESLPEPFGADDNKQQVLDLLAVVPHPGARNSSTEKARTPSRKRSGVDHQGARGAARPRTSKGGASGDVGSSTAPATG
ncbi:unnamed protein product [Ectocarpus sp. 8 AP-2014]